jgi:hypothetical protein
MTDKKKHFLDFKTFWDAVGEKRSHSGALEDINWLEFDCIDYNPSSDEYIADVRMKDEYQDGYMINPYLVKNNLIIMENIHLIHWAEWLNIGVMVKLYPELGKYFFLVSRVELVLDEPTFLDQSMIFRMKILVEKHKEKKHEFTFLNRIGNWVYVIVDYTIVEEQFAIMKHYHEKHEHFLKKHEGAA